MTLYEYYNTGDDNFVSIYGQYWRGQSFTVGTVGTNENHNITSVKIKAKRVGSPGTCTINIYATDVYGAPTGDPLSTGTTNGNDFTTDPDGAWYEIAMSEYTLQASTQYAIVVKALSGSSLNYVGWRRDNSSPTYSGGCYVYSNDSGETWNWATGYDFMFEEYGTAGAGPETHTPSDTAKASSVIISKVKNPFSDTAKSSVSLVFEAKNPFSDLAKASDSVNYSYAGIHSPSDLAKASSSLIFKSKIPFSDLAKASSSLVFEAKNPFSDLAKASDSVNYVYPGIHIPSDLAKALDSLVLKTKNPLSDTANASVSVIYIYEEPIVEPTENINIYR